MEQKFMEFLRGKHVGLKQTKINLNQKDFGLHLHWLVLKDQKILQAIAAYGIDAAAADETMALPGPIANEPTRQVVLHSLQCSAHLLTQSYSLSDFSKKFYELFLPHVAL